MHKILISVLLLAASVATGHIQDSVQQQEDASPKLDCALNNWHFNCLLTRTLITLRKMQQLKDIEISEGVTFVREKPVEFSERSLQVSEKEILNELPQGSLQGTMKLTNMLYDASMSLINSHSLKFDMADVHPVEEARTKLKKNYLMPLLILIGTKIFSIVPLIIGGLTLTSIKAFFISKLALVVALFMAFQKFFINESSPSGTSFNKNPQYGWYDNGAAAADWVPANSNQYGYQTKRSAKIDAHNLAYVGYAQQSNNNAN